MSDFETRFAAWREAEQQMRHAEQELRQAMVRPQRDSSSSVDVMLAAVASSRAQSHEKFIAAMDAAARALKEVG